MFCWYFRGSQYFRQTVATRRECCSKWYPKMYPVVHWLCKTLQYLFLYRDVTYFSINDRVSSVNAQTLEHAGRPRIWPRKWRTSRFLYLSGCLRAGDHDPRWLFFRVVKICMYAFFVFVCAGALFFCRLYCPFLHCVLYCTTVLDCVERRSHRQRSCAHRGGLPSNQLHAELLACLALYCAVVY